MPQPFYGQMLIPQLQHEVKTVGLRISKDIGHQVRSFWAELCIRWYFNMRDPGPSHTLHLQFNHASLAT